MIEWHRACDEGLGFRDFIICVSAPVPPRTYFNAEGKIVEF